MNKRSLYALIGVIGIGLIALSLYPRMFPTKPERQILYWTDPMIPGDRSDRSGKSPMGMDRVPVYADEVSEPSLQGTASATKSYYTCPMHPFIHKDAPGTCPVCGMTLVKKSESIEVSEQGKDNIATVAISPSRQVLASVATTVARRLPLRKEIHAVGTIRYAEPNLRHISMRFPGRMERLYLTYIGEKVKKGDPVAEVYSPDAISAEKEYLLARNSFEEVKDAAKLISSGARSLLDESREKLLRWGFTDSQISELDSSKEVKNTLTIYSLVGGTVLKKSVDPQHYAAAGEDIYDVVDLSTVWLNIDVYEYESSLLRTGQTVEATSVAFPGKIFTGKIGFISPSLEPQSRTVQVRGELRNPREELKLDMYMDAIIRIELPPAIVVPASALLSTGQRDIVWVQKSPGIFEPRAVKVGERTDDGVQILEGITAGDIVVSSGGYLIDSESQMQAPN
jgi:Cu(I)/Ag(I) efflux system membrane fusion protein